MVDKKVHNYTNYLNLSWSLSFYFTFYKLYYQANILLENYQNSLLK